VQRHHNIAEMVKHGNDTMETRSVIPLHRWVFMNFVGLWLPLLLFGSLRDEMENPARESFEMPAGTSVSVFAEGHVRDSGQQEKCSFAAKRSPD
jgi:hypothetical protein